MSESVVMHGRIEITAVSGPTFANKPDYPALRVVDFQVVGELENNGPGYFKVRRRSADSFIEVKACLKPLHRALEQTGNTCVCQM